VKILEGTILGVVAVNGYCSNGEVHLFNLPLKKQEKLINQDASHRL